MTNTTVANFYNVNEPILILKKEKEKVLVEFISPKIESRLSQKGIEAGTEITHLTDDLELGRKILAVKYFSKDIHYSLRDIIPLPTVSDDLAATHFIVYLNESLISESETESSIFKKLTDSDNQFYFLISDRGTIEYASPNASRMLLYPSVYLKKSSIYNYIHVDFINATREKLNRLVRNNLPTESIEILIKTGNGKYINLVANAFNCLNDAHTNGIIVKCEIPASKEQKLSSTQRALKPLDLFFNSTLFGAFFAELEKPVDWYRAKDKELLLDFIMRNMPVVNVNEAFCEHYQMSRADILGNQPADFFKNDLSQGKNLLRQIFENRHFKTETIELDSQGNAKTFEGDYQALYDDKNLLIGIFGIQRDISDRKKFLELLLAQNQTLKKIAWVQSHEVRKPVAQILGALELKNTLKNPEEFSSEDCLSIIEQAAQDLDTLILQLTKRAETIDFLKRTNEQVN
ncbi:MAG: PAS domain S-box protein [Luteibaculaceae bacterium]